MNLKNHLYVKLINSAIWLGLWIGTILYWIFISKNENFPLAFIVITVLQTGVNSIFEFLFFLEAHTYVSALNEEKD